MDTKNKALQESQRVSNLRPDSQWSLDATRCHEMPRDASTRRGPLDLLRSPTIATPGLSASSGQRLVFFAACRNCPITHTEMEFRTASEVSIVIFPSTVGLGWYSESVIQTR